MMEVLMVVCGLLIVPGYLCALRIRRREDERAAELEDGGGA